MLVIGLTGSIATGKSYIAEYLATKGFEIFNADIECKKLYMEKSVIEQVKGILPQAINNEIVNLKILREQLFLDIGLLKKIEKVLYPLLRQTIEELLVGKDKNIVLEIPLLIENNLQNYCDKVILAYADDKIQRQRLEERDIYSNEMIQNILSKQLSFAEKKKYADYVIDTSFDKAHTEQQLNKMLEELNA